MTYPAPELILCKSRRTFEGDNRKDLKNAGCTDMRWEFPSPVFRTHRETGMYWTTNKSDELDPTNA